VHDVAERAEPDEKDPIHCLQIMHV
jgi:hypothetical protein